MKILKYKRVKYLKSQAKARYRKLSLTLMNTEVLAMIGEKGFEYSNANEYVDDTKECRTVLWV